MKRTVSFALPLSFTAMVSLLTAASVQAQPQSADHASPPPPLPGKTETLPAGKASPDPAAARLEKLVLEEMKANNIPAVSVAVLRDGKPVLVTGYGIANLETQTPATAETLYQLASVTKQFTAAAVLLLEEEGKLKVEDPIGKYLEKLPEAWRAVTVRQLLNHTSGIPSYTSLEHFFDQSNRGKDYTPEELVKLTAEKPMDFAPGAKWSYNNTGYILLGMLIEKVSGKPYGEFLRERIFAPLGMTSTRVNDLRPVLRGRAMGYSLENGTLENAQLVSPTQPYSAGALISSVSDMAKWLAALDSGKLLKPETYRAMWTAASTSDGKDAGYGYGWGLDKVNGHPRIHHGGGIPGFSTFTMRLPEDKLSVVVLTNREGANPDRLARIVAGVYVPEVAPTLAEAIPDPNPARTAKLRAVVEQAAKGEADPANFTPEFYQLLQENDRLKQGAKVLGGFGPLGKMELLSVKESDDGTELSYRAVFGSTTLKMMARLDKDGRVAGLGLGPE